MPLVSELSIESGIDVDAQVAKGSEQPRWEWSAGVKECAGCEQTLTLQEVRCWHTNAGGTTVIFCRGCFPEQWINWMRAARAAATSNHD